MRGVARIMSMGCSGSHVMSSADSEITDTNRSGFDLVEAMTYFVQLSSAVVLTVWRERVSPGDNMDMFAFNLKVVNIQEIWHRFNPILMLMMNQSA